MDRRMLQTVKIAALSGCMMLMIASCRPDDKQITRAVTTTASAADPHVTLDWQNWDILVPAS